jgi:hypothetical protein
MCGIGSDFMVRHILAPVDISFHCMVVLDDELYDFFAWLSICSTYFIFLRSHTLSQGLENMFDDLALHGKAF